MQFPGRTIGTGGSGVCLLLFLAALSQAQVSTEPKQGLRENDRTDLQNRAIANQDRSFVDGLPGVRFCIATDGRRSEPAHDRNLPYEATDAVAR